MKIQSMKGTIATLATAATLFISGVVANADTYTVKAGDTLSEIAEDKSTTVEKLVELNHIQNPDLIFVDQVLELGDVKANQASKAAQTAITFNSSNTVFTFRQPKKDGYLDKTIDFIVDYFRCSPMELSAYQRLAAIFQQKQWQTVSWHG